MGLHVAILLLLAVFAGAFYAALSLMGLAAVLDARGAGPAEGPRCAACGYARAGIDAAALCPECGQGEEAARRERHRRER